MDKSDRARYKQLAIDTIVASPVHSEAAQLAEALEKCVEEIEYHGDCVGPRVESDPGPAIVNTLDILQQLHSQLEERLAEIENSITSTENALWEDRDAEIDDLKEHVKDLRQDVKELGDEL